MSYIKDLPNYYLVDPRQHNYINRHFGGGCIVVRQQASSNPYFMHLVCLNDGSRQNFDVWRARYLIPLGEVYFERKHFKGDHFLFRMVKVDDRGYTPVTFYKDQRRPYRTLRLYWSNLEEVLACWIEGVRHEF